MSHVFRRFVSVVAAFAVVAIAGTAFAQRAKPPKPACGITAFPFIEGMEWVFQATAPPTAPTGPVAKPRQPARVIIKVLAVEPPADKKIEETVIKLEEKADDRVYNTTLVCKTDAIKVPPESFFFSGEPGGGLYMELGEVVHNEGSAWTYMFQRGKMVVPTWIEDIDVPFTRTPYPGSNAKMPNGMLDLQRNVIIGMPEEVTTQLGTFSATPVQVDLAGSVTLAFPDGEQKFPIPANTLSKLWFAENIGVVQVYNTNGHLYQLVERVDPTAPPAAPAPAP